ncbi:uncharacterized protein LOC108675590 [Hyalella azteca]|uniref:Uncharacterized protein LOC108675590 n=1 Tax=Hyalella azteca TaxID=294128 RepID=A0A979FUS8_HYAAZ|nr:uncharacterized protein LOC108675590 [Hyalella azteca]
MLKKKATKSFADALLSADVDVELPSKPKKFKPKLSTACQAARNKETVPNKGLSQKSFPQSRPDRKSFPNKGNVNVDKNRRNSVPSQAENCTAHSSSQKTKSEIAFSKPFKCPYSANFRKIQDSDSESEDFENSSKVEESHFVSNRQIGKADKRVKKLLAEDKEQEDKAKILLAVDEELMIFDLQLEDEMQAELEEPKSIHITVLPSGIPFLHSLHCHTLYAPEKVMWPFVPSIAGSKGSSRGNTAALMRWLGSLNATQVKELILSRALMEPELPTDVVCPLLKYLIRYIAAHPLAPSSLGSDKAVPPEEVGDKAVPPEEGGDDEMVTAAHQLITFHLTTSTAPAALLKSFLAEIPLALVNLGGNQSCFPHSTLACWSISSELHHNKTPNSASDSCAQMNSIKLLLNALCSGLAQLTHHLSSTETQMASSSVEEGMLDALVSWLCRLGQDPAVLTSSLHTTVATAISHTLQLYRDFQAKVQDLVEIISEPWLSNPDSEESGSNEAGSDSSKSFPHHTASFVCHTLLANSHRCRQLASSLAFLALTDCLQCDSVEVLDAVEMSDTLVTV